MVKQCQYKDKENRQCPQAAMQTAFPEGSDYCAWHDPGVLERARASTHHLVSKVLHKIVHYIVEGRTAGRSLYKDTPDPNAEVVWSYVMGKIDHQADEYNLIRDSLEKAQVDFYEIKFTYLDQGCKLTINRILEGIKKARFIGCEFDSFFERKQRADLTFMSVLPKGFFCYKDCYFSNLEAIVPMNSTTFDDCVFDGDTVLEFGSKDLTLDGDYSASRRVFEGSCAFRGKLKLGMHHQAKLIDDYSYFYPPSRSLSSDLVLHGFCFSKGFYSGHLLSSFERQELISIKFERCTFKARFEINEETELLYTDGGLIALKGDNFKEIGSIEMEGCALEDKLEIKNKKIDLLRIINTKFKKTVDFNKLEIGDLFFFRADFESFFAFEETSVLPVAGQAVFKYSTFHNHATFRNAKFLGGLDLDRANFSGEANFLGVDADGGNIANTTRETYRLIKHSFDNIGNHLEANKFFAKEMDKYRDEVSGNKSLPWWDRAVFHINKNVSDFGQNYLLSIGWLLLFMVGYFYTFVLHRHFRLIHNESSCDVFENGYDTVNCLASGMIPFKGFLTNGMELLSLFFYIIFAVLVWQTVVALKRHTRR